MPSNKFNNIIHPCISCNSKNIIPISHTSPKLSAIPQKNPEIYFDDFLCQAAIGVIVLLTNPPFTTTLFLKSGDITKNVLIEITKILQCTNKITNIPANLFFLKSLKYGNGYFIVTTS